MSAPAAAFPVTPADAGQRLDRFLAAHLPALSRSQIQRLIEDGHVTLSRGRAKPGLAIAAGTEVTVVVPPPAPATTVAEDLPLTILYEDQDIVVVDKPAGMVVHPAAGHRSGTLVNALLHHIGGLSRTGGADRPGIVHRLDRGTSGVMVIARNDLTHRTLSKAFQDRKIEKRYVAVVWGAVKTPRSINVPIGRDPKHRTRMSSRARHVRVASTTIVSVEPMRGVTYIAMTISTGRTHQIRVHLSELGHPVVGDAVYGGVRPRYPSHLASLASLERPFLHAESLTFDHPGDGRRLTFTAPLPPDLATRLATLRARAHKS